MNTFKNILIFILLFVVGVLIGYIVYDKTHDKENNSNTVIQDSSGNNNNNSDINSDNNNSEENDVRIKVLSIDDVEVGNNLINHPMSVKIKIDLDYDESKVSGVNISGYCIDDENTKYNIHGPGSGANFFYKNSDEYVLVNSTDMNGKSEVYLSDGSLKESIDWDNVKIRSCTIEKANVFSAGDSINKLNSVDLNFKQNIN